ncbi:MAG: tetratricopeptide repeat protein [Elusimicrobia bacterium]|nr:tetratricopeptide repeat protein [Elusimicrobiota bacterium]
MRIFLVLCWCVSLSMAQAAPNGLSRHLQMGKDAFDAQRYSQALDHFLEVHRMAPENMEAKTYITRIGEAWRQIELQTVLNPEDRKKAFQDVYELLEKRKGKIADLSRDLEVVRRQLESGSADAQGLIKASRSLSRFKEMGLEDRVLEQQSQYYIQLLQEQLRRAVGRGGAFQNQKDILVARGFLWYYKNDLGNALKEWNKALVLSPEDSMLKEQILWVSRKKTLMERNRTVEELFSQARTQFGAQNYPQALLYLRSLVLLEPENKEFQKYMLEAQEKVRKTATQQKLKQAYGALRKKHLAEASQFFIEILEVDPTHRESLEKLKEIQQELYSRLSSARPQKQTASVSSRTPSSKLSDEQYTLGLIYYSQGELEKARGALEVALQHNPSNEKATNALERIQAEVLP